MSKMLKRLIFVTLFLLITACQLSAFAESGICGDHTRWNLDTSGNLIISGSGAIQSNNWPMKKVQTVTIQEGVTELCSWAFAEAESLRSVSLPTSLTKIGNTAFYRCGNLQSISIPSRVPEIPDFCFCDCVSLKELSLPETIVRIGEWAFYGCKGIDHFVLPQQIEEVAENSFGNHTLYSQIGSKTAMTLGKAGYSFRIQNDQGKFQYMQADGGALELTLKSVDQGLKSYCVPADIVSIGSGCFSNSQYAMSVTLPAETIRLSSQSFRQFSGFLKFEGEAPQIASDAFMDGRIIVTYPSGGSGWSTAQKQDYGAAWIYWHAETDTSVVPDTARDESERMVADRTNNNNDQSYSWNWSDPVNSYLVPDTDGSFFRVEQHDQVIVVEQYTEEIKLIWKKTIPLELPVWGGFFCGEKYNFLIEGQNNPNEDDNTEIMRVIRYTKNWHRVDDAGVYGANTVKPFNAGSLRVSEKGDFLYIHTCHTMYKSPDGLNHQANMSYTLHVPSMTYAYQGYEVSYHNYDYASHSFNQFVLVDGDDIIKVDHGDAYPRSIRLVRHAEEAGTPAYNIPATVTLLRISGETGDNYTGVTIGGLEASDSRYIVVGKSINQQAFGKNKRDNIFVATASKKDFTDESVTFRWITSFTDGESTTLSTPQLVKIMANRLLLLWTENASSSKKTTTLRYVFLDGNGNTDSPIYQAEGALSDCKPVASSGEVTWYVTTNSGCLFYTIQLSNPSEVLVRKEDLSGWVEENGKFCYLDAEGNKTKGWLQIDGKTYYFHSSGYLQTGWQKISNIQYYFDPDGVMAQGWYRIGTDWFFFETSGKMKTGWHEEHDETVGKSIWYYLKDNGALAVGWEKIQGQWYYFEPERGVMQTGIQNIGGEIYAFAASGEMQTGWFFVQGTWYYLSKSGAAARGWMHQGTVWYYFSEQGEMMTGWQTISGTRYYFHDSGSMAAGWTRINQIWYHFSEDGTMSTGWFHEGAQWYYFTSEGEMVTGWQNISGIRYYFHASGSMAAGWTQINQIWYHFSEDGAMNTGWFQEETKWYYFTSGGEMVTGWKEINGQWEVFSDNGVWLYTWNGT